MPAIAPLHGCSFQVLPEPFTPTMALFFRATERVQGVVNKGQDGDNAGNGRDMIQAIRIFDRLVADLVDNGARNRGNEIGPHPVPLGADGALQEQHDQTGEDADRYPVIRCFHAPAFFCNMLTMACPVEVCITASRPWGGLQHPLHGSGERMTRFAPKRLRLLREDL